MTTLLGPLLNELVETYLQTVDHAVELHNVFEDSVRLEGLENPTTESIQRVCWRIDYYGRGYLMKFLSYNKRFTKAMNALSAYHSANVDQPAASRITGVLTESWLKRLQLYRKTRRVFHVVLKNMNLRREQLKVWVVPKENEASCVQVFEQKITIDQLAIRELAGPETVWYNDCTYPPSASLEDIPDINDIDGDYAGRALLSMDASTHAHLDHTLSPASGEGMEHLGAGVKEAFASDNENPASLENVRDVQEYSIAATPATKTVETKSPTDPPYHFWVMAFLVLATSIVLTVGTVVRMLATLLSSLLPRLIMLALKLQGWARKAPPTEIDLDISILESMTSAEKPSPSSMEQSLLASRLLISTSGESIEPSSISLTTPTFTRPSKMLEAQAMANKFNDDCAEASFCLSQISITDTTPPGRLWQFSKQL